MYFILNKVLIWLCSFSSMTRVSLLKPSFQVHSNRCSMVDCSYYPMINYVVKMGIGHGQIAITTSEKVQFCKAKEKHTAYCVVCTDMLHIKHYTGHVQWHVAGRLSWHVLNILHYKILQKVLFGKNYIFQHCYI